MKVKERKAGQEEILWRWLMRRWLAPLGGQFEPMPLLEGRTREAKAPGTHLSPLPLDCLIST